MARDVPSHWEIVRLKHLCCISPSNVDKHAYEDEEPVLLCNYTDVYYNKRITRDITFMAATASVDQIAKFTLRAGDTIITKDSETADDIAIAAYVPQDLDGVICGYHLSIVRPRSGVCGAFVKRVFDSHYAKACFAVASNGLTRVGLSQYTIDNFVVAVPPLAEQVAIARFIDREMKKLDSLISEQRRLVELLQEKRRAAIANVVTKGLNPTAPVEDSGIDWLGKMPKHWEVKAIRNIANVVRGASPRPAGDPLYFGGDWVPWVTVAEITKDESIYLTDTESSLTEEGARHSNLFSKGTLIYSNSGATLGVPKILGIDACANDGVIAFKELSLAVDPRFLYYYLASITDAIREKVKQGSGQPNLNTYIVKALRLGLPPLSEQQRIIGHIEELTVRFRRLAEEAQSAIALLQERSRPRLSPPQ